MRVEQRPLEARQQASRRSIVFCSVGIADAPLAPGIYLLYRGFTLIYIGLAPPGTTIREALLRHYHGAEGPCTRVATQFEYEVSDRPEALYERRAEAHRWLTGEAAPRCNHAARDVNCSDAN